MASINGTTVPSRMIVRTRVAEGDTAMGSQRIFDGTNHHGRWNVAKHVKTQSLQRNGKRPCFHWDRQHDDARQAGGSPINRKDRQGDEEQEDVSQ
eukprot:scaffold278940_cov35-Tisochrysis_lutea.AAC.3